jgi:PAS domain S-box-containing protein
MIDDQAQSMLDAICDTALDAVVAADHDGIVVAFNKHAETLFGHKAKDAVGRPMADLIVPERHREAHNAGMKRYLTTGTKKIIGGTVEIDALHADGHEINVELGLSTLKTIKGEVFLSFLRDLTRRNQREAEIKDAQDKAERANVSKSFVISMLAHDMRTAVGGVTGSIALLDREGMPERERELVAAINASAHQLRRLLDDTLDFARLESGEIEVSRTPVRVRDVVEEISQSWGPRLANLNMGFTVTVDETTPPLINFDIARLRQVLGNLIANSMKYAPESQVTVAFSGRADNGLSITISDTGNGFSTEALSTAFEPFVRPSGQKAKGAGLGLTIVKTLVERLDGTVVLGATAEGGARTDLEFPACRLEDSEPKAEAAPQPTTSFDGIGVLLVEDNATNQLIATRFLEQLGCDVTVCADGESGVHTAEQIGFDVIFMDIDLPKLNGKDAMRAIRSGSGPNAEAPLIAFTAFALRSQKDEIMASGANTILTKPITGREDFETILHAVLRSRKSVEQRAKTESSNLVIDPQRLHSLRSTLGDTDFRDLASEFVKDLKSLQQSLAAQDCDPESIRKTTHIAVSVTGAIGASKAQSYAEALNASAHSPNLEGLQSGVADLQGALGETMTALGQFLEAS